MEKIWRISLLLLLLLILGFGGFLLTKRLGRVAVNSGDGKSEDEEIPISVCGWIPWWDYERAEGEFLMNKELFETISPFVYILTEDRQIEEKLSHLETKIKTYKQDAGVRVIPSVYNDFDGERVSRIINSEVLRKRHIQDLVEIVKTTDADGIEIDYEYLNEEDREVFSSFVEDLAQELHQEDKLLTLTLHPKTAEPGNWYGARAQDWESLAEEADFLRIMIYDYNWRASGPGPISPLPWFKEVVSFAKAAIPYNKIVIGVPLYGYDWVSGSRGAKELTLIQIEEILEKEGLRIRNDEKSKSPFLVYQDTEGNDHQIWFEDKTGLSAKIDAVRTAGLNKICLWRLGGVPQDYYEFIGQKVN